MLKLTFFKGKFTSAADVAHAFRIPLSVLDSVHLLIASYAKCKRSGIAFILYSRDDRLYEINANHCSCGGLEGQWIPDETTTQSLLFRLAAQADFGLDSKNCGEDYRDELLAIIHLLEDSA